MSNVADVIDEDLPVGFEMKNGCPDDGLLVIGYIKSFDPVRVGERVDPQTGVVTPARDAKDLYACVVESSTGEIKVNAREVIRTEAGPLPLPAFAKLRRSVGLKMRIRVSPTSQRDNTFVNLLAVDAEEIE